MQGCSQSGTRFRLYPRPPYVDPAWPTETVHVSTPPRQMGPGPSDHRIYVIEPIGKRESYGFMPGPGGAPYLNLPPWRGQIDRAAHPDREGHFDGIPVGTLEFEQAHLFGTIRRVMDIWEGYLGGAFDWHFAGDFDRLEVLLRPSLNNAMAGYGFMEVGAQHDADGTVRPFALNFDVIAHELGHLIIYSTIGVPTEATARGEYFGFHESAADTTALIASAHFDYLIESLLEGTRGNFYTYNELDRFAELSATRQVRLASNSVKLSEFANGWHDEHALSQPLTGALFDILVDIFQEYLVENDLIERRVADLTEEVRKRPDYQTFIQSAFDEAYPGKEEEFRAAFIAARDYWGRALAETWKRMSPDFLEYAAFADLLLDVDRELSGGRFQQEMIESFVWRDIGRVRVGPRLSPPDRHSHAFSPRTIVPDIEYRQPRMTFRERFRASRQR
jgi:hypothetical protein